MVHCHGSHTALPNEAKCSVCACEVRCTEYMNADQPETISSPLQNVFRSVLLVCCDDETFSSGFWPEKTNRRRDVALMNTSLEECPTWSSCVLLLCSISDRRPSAASSQTRTPRSSSRTFSLSSSSILAAFKPSLLLCFTLWKKHKKHIRPTI